MAREDFGEATDLEVIDRLVGVDGKSLADIGCGDGWFAHALAGRGARVLAIEPDPAQAKKNREAGPVAGVRFVEAAAAALPAAPGTLDGAVFGRSLHHVPHAGMGEALTRAIDALVPEQGFLLVIEPVSEGTYDALSRPFRDETGVRQQAIEALARYAAPRFAEAREIVYRSVVTYESFEAFVAERVSATYNDIDRKTVDTPRVRALFEAGRDGDTYRFDYVSRINFYRRPLDGG